MCEKCRRDHQTISNEPKVSGEKPTPKATAKVFLVGAALVAGFVWFAVAVNGSSSSGPASFQTDDGHTVASDEELVVGKDGSWYFQDNTGSLHKFDAEKFGEYSVREYPYKP